MFGWNFFRIQACSCRWVRCDAQLKLILRPLLDRPGGMHPAPVDAFTAAQNGRLLPAARLVPACSQLLPLLVDSLSFLPLTWAVLEMHNFSEHLEADLASDRWPRACLHDPEVWRLHGLLVRWLASLDR